MTTHMYNIVPSPAMIRRTISSDDLTVDRCISELVDNAFGPAAGDADNVTITFEADRIIFEDDGRGTENMAALFKYAESPSRSDPNEIGQYGIGAKEAFIWLGKKTRVVSYCGNIAKRAELNWDKIKDLPEWPPLSVDEHEVEVGRRTGTSIEIIGLRNIKRFRTLPLVKKLGETYASALRAGKTITVINTRKGYELEEVQPFLPEGLSDVETLEGEVGGKRYTIQIGILSEVYRQNSGIRFCFGHRVIEKRTVLNGKSLPARIFGYVELDRAWKFHLGANKVSVRDSDELEEDIERLCSEKLRLADEYESEIFLEKIAADLSVAVSKVLRKDADGNLLGARAEPKSEGTRTRKHPAPPMTQVTVDGMPASEEEKPRASGLQIKIVSWGDGDVGRITENDLGMLAEVNKDSPLIGQIYAEMKTSTKSYNAGFLGLLGFLIANYAQTEKGVGWVREKTRMALTDKNKIASEVLRWWCNVVTKTLWEEAQ